eukprot:XP_023156258.1 uncharacterized protein LOC100278168 isoform X5 [Zea mays]
MIRNPGNFALETEPFEPVLPIVEPAKMHSLSMKEDNFTCFVTEEILIRELEDGGAANIQERPLLMVEKVEKVRTTLADLLAAEVFSSIAPGENSCHNIIDVGASTSKHTSWMEKVHQKKPRKPTPKPLKGTRKLSQVMRKMLGKKIHPEQLNGRSNAEGPLTVLLHDVYSCRQFCFSIWCYLQKRVLNSSKGPAVRALRAQPDKREYAIEMKNSVESTENLFIREAMATEVLIGKNDTIEGVCTFFSMDFMHHLLYLAPEHS